MIRNEVVNIMDTIIDDEHAIIDMMDKCKEDLIEDARNDNNLEMLQDIRTNLFTNIITLLEASNPNEVEIQTIITLLIDSMKIVRDSDTMISTLITTWFHLYDIKMGN